MGCNTPVGRRGLAGQARGEFVRLVQLTAELPMQGVGVPGGVRPQERAPDVQKLAAGRDRSGSWAAALDELHGHHPALLDDKHQMTSKLASMTLPGGWRICIPRKRLIRRRVMGWLPPRPGGSDRLRKG